MYQNEHTDATRSNKRRKTRRTTKTTTLVISLLVILVVAAGGTLAYLATNTTAIKNTFTPSHVTCEVTENFDGTEKTGVNVKNTSDIKAYIRVKLVTYRVNDKNEHIGGTASIPAFTPGQGWVEHEGYYYYTKPVAPGEEPEKDLIQSITLEDSYSAPDGGKQVIEVMAEAIQSQGTDDNGVTPVELAWGVTIGNDNVSAYPAQ